MLLDLSNCKIYFSRAGIYLSLFTLGLASSSYITGSNILLLLDLFLVGLLIFNFIYLILLRKFVIEIELDSVTQEQTQLPIRFLTKDLNPLKANLHFNWTRFGECIKTTSNILYFNDEWLMAGDTINLRGLYKLHNIEIEIEFPFPLFLLRNQFSTKNSLIVLPLPIKSSSPLINPDSAYQSVEDSFSHYCDYSPGDSIKLISWKQYARTGDLMIKKFDFKSQSHNVFVINYNVSNEKKIFQETLAILAREVSQQNSFTIISKSEIFQFDGEHFSMHQLLRFLACYEQPSELPQNVKSGLVNEGIF